MEKTFALSTYGDKLWTRDRAREIRKDLIAILEESVVGDIIAIDLSGVEVFDISFASEFFGKTILELPKDHPGRFIAVENLNNVTRENLERAIETLGLPLIERRGGKLALIGKVHPADKETFIAIAKAQKPVTSAELKDQLKVNLTAMNERLKKLTELGLIRKEQGVSQAGREQFEYSIYN